MRLSFGVESLEKEAQDSKRKPIDKRRLEKVAEWCLSFGIKPRALLIIGLTGQTATGINETVEYLDSLGVELRFRSLMDLSILGKNKLLCGKKLKTLDRWMNPASINGMNVQDIRSLEFPTRVKTNYC